MRHSIGAAWIFSLCITFTMLFVGYMAISLNYAKAFKIKNHLVSMIEENEGYNPSLDNRIEKYFISEGYVASGTCKPNIKVEGYDEEYSNPVCIGPVAGTSECQACIYKRRGATIRYDNGEVIKIKTNYRVVTFFKFDLPIIKNLTNFQVSGESRYFYEFANMTGLPEPPPETHADPSTVSPGISHMTPIPKSAES